MSSRTSKEILDATRAFASESRARSWMHVIVCFALLAALAAGALFVPSLPARIACSIVESLVIVRAFILLHDFLHNAILRGSRAADLLFSAFGMLLLTPPRVWKETHNYHHKNNGKIIGSHIGSYPVVTTEMYQQMSRVQRFGYLAARHPINMLLGYWTVFGWGMCVSPFLRAPKRNWLGPLALLAQCALAWLTVAKLGWTAYFLGVLGPLAGAMCVGSYLFYAQHNFPEGRFRSRTSWEYVAAALESSSYMEMGPVMRFFTGNIGYHHVHHLNPTIPFYRLPEAMQAIPELRDPPTTSLRMGDIASCFQLDLWDPGQSRFVSLSEARRQPVPMSQPAVE